MSNIHRNNKHFCHYLDAYHFIIVILLVFRNTLHQACSKRQQIAKIIYNNHRWVVDETWALNGSEGVWHMDPGLVLEVGHAYKARWRYESCI